MRAYGGGPRGLADRIAITGPKYLDGATGDAERTTYLMTAADIDKLYQRIDELFQKIGDLNEVVARSLAACDSCRPFVMGGNGKPALADRLNQVQQEINDVKQGLSERIASVNNELTILKTAREIGGRMFWAGVGVAGTISGGVGGVLLKWWLGTTG